MLKYIVVLAALSSQFAIAAACSNPESLSKIEQEYCNNLTVDIESTVAYDKLQKDALQLIDDAMGNMQPVARKPLYTKLTDDDLHNLLMMGNPIQPQTGSYRDYDDGVVVCGLNYDNKPVCKILSYLELTE